MAEAGIDRAAIKGRSSNQQDCPPRSFMRIKHESKKEPLVRAGPRVKKVQVIGCRSQVRQRERRATSPHTARWILHLHALLVSFRLTRFVLPSTHVATT